MNKLKIALAAFLVMGTVFYTSLAYSKIGAPETSNGSSVDPIYGGVEFSRSYFSTAPVQVYGSSGTYTPGVVVGVYFSSGDCFRNDYIVIRDTNPSVTSGTSVINSTVAFTFYNNVQSTGSLGGNWAPGGTSPSCGGFQALPFGVVVSTGLNWNVSVSSYNQAGVLYRRTVGN